MSALAAVHFSKYELKKRDSSGVRQGSLLKFDWQDGLCGFADLHPWPELGQPGLLEQLRVLAELVGKSRADVDFDRRTQTYLMRYPQAAMSLQIATLDAFARAESRSLLDPVKDKIPESHFLSSSWRELLDHDLQAIVRLKFDRVKIKITPSQLNFQIQDEWRELVKVWPDQLQLRLDANARFSHGQFVEYFQTMPPDLRAKIEFCEDPIPYSFGAWLRLNKEAPCAWASDWEQVVEESEFQFKVLKPVAGDASFSGTQPVIVTSLLDHPLGQNAAALFAVRWQEQGLNLQNVRSGLLSHVVYEQNEFSENFNANAGPSFQLQNWGTGLGFDELLKKQNWRLLKK